MRGKGRRQRGSVAKQEGKTAYRLPLTPDRKAASAALVIFAKAPIPGQVKTRLCPPLTPDEAATLHGTFVLEIVERSQGAVAGGGIPIDRFVACAPSPDHAFFKVLEARHGVRLLPQLGQDLGARMHGAIRSILDMGYSLALVVGTDVPLLPRSSFGEAVSLLTEHDVVFGPALDGGYYLIGLRRPIPELFENIPWSTAETLATTLKKAETLGLQTAMLPACRDIDRLEDLLALIDEISGGTGYAVKGKRSSPLTSHPLPLTHPLSKRTMGVLQTLAGRLRRRERASNPLTTSRERRPP